MSPLSGMLSLCYFIWHVSSRNGEACCQLLYLFALPYLTCAKNKTTGDLTTYRPGGGETISPPPADGSSTRGGSASVRERVRSPHVATLQAASVPIHRVTMTRFCSISMPVDFCRHLVGKNVCYCDSVFYALLVRQCLQCFDAVGWAAGRASGL